MQVKKTKLFIYEVMFVLVVLSRASRRRTITAESIPTTNSFNRFKFEREGG